MSRLTAVYDLAHSPPTYDIIAFLCEVERERLARGDSEVSIVFSPGPAGGFRQDPFWPRSVAEREALLANIAMPLCRLLPSVVSVTRARTPVSGFGSGRGLYGFARQVAASRDGIRPLRAKPPPPRDPRLIAITLREAEHWPERNSFNDVWLDAADRLMEHGFDVTVVRDTLRASEPFGGCRVDRYAATSILPRASLYARAAVNLGVSNGPIWMAMTMDVPTIVFRPVNDKLGAQFGSERYRACGVEPGGQIPGAPPWQRLIWEDETPSGIVDAVLAMLGKPR